MKPSYLLPLVIICALTAGSIAQTAPPTPPPPAPANAFYPEKELPAPFNPALPTIFIVGDSTASYHPDRTDEGAAAIQGWGYFLPAFFDPTRVNVVNAARGGRSTRTYMTEGLWQKVLAQVKPHDIVLIQLGQNDVFELNDKSARGTIPGIGDQTQEIDNIVTHKHEVVHTFGWYLRNYVKQAREKGATPIVMSLTTRNVWKDGQVEVGVNNYRESSWRIANSEGHTDFVDVSEIIAQAYRKLGPDKTAGLFHTREQVHINTAGAFLDTRCIVAGLEGLTDAPITPYLSYLGQEITPVSPPIPTEWSQPAK
ncbi:GDSL-type esterase/lipase family protein [Granulicella tundricola]|uniref:Lipolytic protein G-D-S-L family n=1 Tax=Granulicella tundricola (strain ATCC BAA-1859 / DSM 23138 / MP5ACTX9) TaxID=1198114 RepID=E8X416_GRATM|nr:GDSL-type esterase/lipase family protein [Granulicella tundricola]ADW70524.1 lipolytic protein G-D-S-L family [Granulicella tundricola MP5ACTX9]